MYVVAKPLAPTHITGSRALSDQLQRQWPAAQTAVASARAPAHVNENHGMKHSDEVLSKLTPEVTVPSFGWQRLRTGIVHIGVGRLSSRPPSCLH